MQAQQRVGQLQGVSCSNRIPTRLHRAEACAGQRTTPLPRAFGASVPNIAKAQLWGTKVKVSTMDLSSLLPSQDELDRLHLEHDDSTFEKAQLLQEVSSLRSQLRITVAERNRFASLAEQAQNSLEKLQNDARVIAHWEKVHLWSQYAAARKRILKLMDEKEMLEIKLSREKTESRCQIRHRLEVEQKLQEANRQNEALKQQLHMQLSPSVAS